MYPIFRTISALMLLCTISFTGSAQGGDVSMIFQGNSFLSPGSYQANTNVITVEFWSFREEWNMQGREVMLSWHENGGWEFRLDNSNLQLAAYLDGVERLISFPASGVISGWHHFAFTFDGNYLKYYIDGYQRGYIFDFRSVLTPPSDNTWLCLGSSATVNGAAGQYFSGRLSEFRIWNKAIAVNDLRDWMHSKIDSVRQPSYITNLKLYYPFDTINRYGDYAAILNATTPYNLIHLNAVTDSVNTAPCIYASASRLNMRALWSTFVQGTFSEPSGGMNLGITNYDPLDNFESDLFSHNGAVGTFTDGTTDGVDIQSNRVWFVTKRHDEERPTVRIQIFEAGAGALYYDCIPVNNYKLMYKTQPEDTFRIVAEGDDLDGNLVFFREVELEAGYYAIARDNDVPTVNSAMEVTNITTNSADFGGIIGCDGGTPVSAYGVCWNKSGSATIFDSLTVDGFGTGLFSSSIFNLESGVIYYARAYATNAEGTAYGEEVTFQTNKMYQSVTFPTLPEKTYGAADFEPGAMATSGLPVSYTSSKPEVAEIRNGLIHVNSVGSTTIWAFQPGNTNYSPSSYKKVTLTVNKAELTIRVRSFDHPFGDPLPALEYSMTGFVNNEHETVLDQLPLISTTASDSCSTGLYAIFASGGSDDHYTFNYVNGSVNVVKRDPVIEEWPEISPLFQGDALCMTWLSVGTSTVEGSFGFVDSTYVPNYDGEEIEVIFVPTDAGNYNSVIHKTAVMLYVATSDNSEGQETFTIGPNPAKDFIQLFGEASGLQAAFFSITGELEKVITISDQPIDIRAFKPGFYLVKCGGQTRIFLKK